MYGINYQLIVYMLVVLVQEQNRQVSSKGRLHLVLL